MKLKINGREYSMKIDDAEQGMTTQKVQSFAGELDRQISELTFSLPNRTEEEILTLIALNTLIESSSKVDALESAVQAGKQELSELRIALKNSELSVQSAVSENLHSAESELEHIASVKDEENNRLQSKLMEYEHEFEVLNANREKEINKLKESYGSAISELEHIAQVKDTENSKLRQTLNSYEKSFDLSMRAKEEEIASLREKLHDAQLQLDALRRDKE
jgi:cell division protein ZapA (FtsZ GTPase activity inhibitor)